MPKISDMKESKFLKQTDVGAGLLCTVAAVTQENVAKQGAEPEMKWCLVVEESDKPLVLNSTNIQLCAKVLGSEDTDDWTGKKIVFYTDPNVSYGGKIVGGIRVRAPKPKTNASKPPARPVVEEEEDTVPF